MIQLNNLLINYLINFKKLDKMGEILVKWKEQSKIGLWDYLGKVN